jgi:hypothetical protein
MQKNITLDFTANKAVENLTAGQPLAIMPAELAKKLLMLYATELRKSTAYNIVSAHISNLRRIMDASNDVLSEAIVCSINWIQERDLIDNVVAENWDAYTVVRTDPEGNTMHSIEATM